MRHYVRGAVFLAMAVGLTGAVAGTPTAGADPDGSTYAAIAYSPTSGKTNTVWNAPSQLKADNDAVSGCNANGRTTDCLVAAESNYCVSIATDPNPNNNAPYSGGHGATLAAADQMALAGLPGSTIEDHRCNE
jgi:hypothetical protein